MINDNVIRQLNNQINDEDVFKDKQRKEEIIRIMIQTLCNLGYKDTANILQNESGVNIEPQNITIFKQQIQDGNWDQATLSLYDLKIDSGKIQLIFKLNKNLEINIQNCKFLIAQQKYLELIAKGDTQGALKLLRGELTILCIEDKSLLHKLASLIICNNLEKIQQKIGWTGNDSIEQSRLQLISKIQTLAKPPQMIEQNSILYQVLQCPQHIKLQENFSLIDDHKCCQIQTPDKCIQILKENSEEVWLCKFSTKGTYLCTAAKNKTITVWSYDLLDNKAKFQYKIQKPHTGDIQSVSFSLDDKQFLSTSTDRSVKIYSSQTGDVLHTLLGHNETVMSGLWHPTNGYVYTGGIDNFILIWNGQDFSKVGQINTNRCIDIKLNSDGSLIIVLCASYNRINIIDTVKKTQITTIQESDIITSMSLSSDDKLILLNTSYKDPELHLWSLESMEIINRFQGYTQEKFKLSCSIGGVNEMFIAVGGEDGRIHIWNKFNPKIQTIIQMHQLPVNQIAWNPVNKNILVSASDDFTVKIFAPPHIADRLGELNIEDDEHENVNPNSQSEIEENYIMSSSQIQEADEEDEQDEQAEEEDEEVDESNIQNIQNQMEIEDQDQDNQGNQENEEEEQ